MVSYIIKFFLIFISIMTSACSDINKGEGNRDQSLTFFDRPEKDRLPYFRGKDLEAFWLKPDQKLTEARKVDPFKFTNQLNAEFGLENLKNKITAVSFFFAKCNGICPNITRNLIFVQSSYKDNPNVQLVSFSVTPDLDTPEALRKFADEKGIISGKWNLLTGPRNRIHSMARTVFQADTNTINKNPNDFVHSEQIFLIDKNLYFRGVYNGNKGDSVQTMISDIKILENETSVSN